MTEDWTRRRWLGALGASWASACAPSREPAQPAAVAPDELQAIEARLRARVGVYAVDTGTGRELAHRAEERFAMCSTFKWALAAAILARVDGGELALTDTLSYAEADLLEHSPVTREHVAKGALSVEQLLRAAVVVSDNTAANVLLAHVDGPFGLTRFIRAQGDDVTQLDRNEPSLNEVAPGDARDTTSPRAMAELLRRVLLGDTLLRASRERLIAWMVECETGRDRLRAGLPAGWRAGDKTGTGPAGTVNDVAVAWPPGRSPIVLCAFLTGGSASLEARVRAHAEIGRLVAKTNARSV